MRSNRSKHPSQQKIAQERIEELFKQANKGENPNRCVKIARNISLKYKVPFTKVQKLQYCKKCESYLKPGKNSRIRLVKGRTIVLCLGCKNIMRYQHK